MRLSLLPPAGLTAEQKRLYDDMVSVIATSFGELAADQHQAAVGQQRQVAIAAKIT
jgi:hypothetical protein